MHPHIAPKRGAVATSRAKRAVRQTAAGRSSRKIQRLAGLGGQVYTRAADLQAEFAGLVERCDVEILVNGEPRHVPAETTVATLLDDLQLQPRYLAVERNRVLVPRATHALCVLQAGDRVEIVTLVGGG